MILPGYARDPEVTDKHDLAGAVLRSAAGCWFFVTLIGQWLFLYYIVVQYYALTLSGHFEDWKFGYLPGDIAGNLALAAHVLLADVVVFGGLLQLIPQIRERAIAAETLLRARGWAVFFGLNLSVVGLAGDAEFAEIGRRTLARLCAN